MANNSTVTKLLQVSEEAAPAVQIPIIVGNEVLVLTQQDIRRVEDIRVLSYNRLATNGSMPTQWDIYAIGNLLNNSFGPATQPRTLQGLFPQVQAMATESCPNADQDMQKVPSRAVANIAKQLSWAKSSKPSAPYPMSYSVATSTSGLQKKISDHDMRQESAVKKDCSCQRCTINNSPACNTEARTTSTSQATNTEARTTSTSQATNTEARTTSTSQATNTEARTKTTSQATNTEARTKTTSQACNTEPKTTITSQATNTSSIGLFRSHKFNDSSWSDISCNTSEEQCLCEQTLPKQKKQQELPHKQRSPSADTSPPDSSRSRHGKSKTLNPHITVENLHYAENQAKKQQVKGKGQKPQQLSEAEQQPSQIDIGHSTQQ